MKKSLYLILIFTSLCISCFGQTAPALPAKISHAEPIFVDLIRDLGARKGEKELNVGMGMTSLDDEVVHSYLVEYEFAPVNRLGMEIEVPISFHRAPSDNDGYSSEVDGLEGIKMAAQYSFLVWEKLKTTMAVGYIFETRRKGFDLFHVTGSMHNPFFTIAKKWGSQFHTLVNAGVAAEHEMGGNRMYVVLINADFHYVLTGTKNFVGVEFNEEIEQNHFRMMIRPQVKMALMSTSSLGIALGIPTAKEERKLDVLVRWIYEFRKKTR
jgi:hypothetical protein